MNLIAPLMENLANGIGGVSNYFRQHPRQTEVASAALAAAGAFAAFRLGRGLLGHGALLSRGLKRFAGEGGEIVAEGLAHGARGPGISAFLARSLTVPALRSVGADALVLGGRLFNTARNPIFGIAPMMEQLAKLAPLFLRVGSSAKWATVAADSLRIVVGEGLGRAFGWLLGRAIPVVGEILLLKDAIGFLGAHAKDIGWAIGKAARWIVKEGTPLLYNAIKDTLVTVIKWVADTVQGGGLIKAAYDAGSSGWAAFNDDGTPKKSGGIPSLQKLVTPPPTMKYHNLHPQWHDSSKKTTIDPKKTAPPNIHYHNLHPQWHAPQVGDVYHIGKVTVQYSGTDVKGLLNAIKLNARRGDSQGSTHGLPSAPTTTLAGSQAGH